MPEILVENEPWLGLVVLGHLSRQNYKTGYYGLARAAEWHSDSKNITVWKGPELKDEVIARHSLQEVECRTVLVDEQGFYTCPPIIDELKDAVEKASEEILNDLANERAVEAWSYVESENAEKKYDTDEVYAIASAGDAVAVNGELSYGKNRPPRNYIKTEDGGRDPSSQEETVDKDQVSGYLTRRLSDEFKREISEEDIRRALDKIYRTDKNYIVWGSDSTNTEVYISRRAYRAWVRAEEDREEKRRKTEALHRAEEARRRQEEEERQRQERREKVRRGGFPSPKDWSPRGRLPGDR